MQACPDNLAVEISAQVNLREVLKPRVMTGSGHRDGGKLSPYGREGS